MDSFHDELVGPGVTDLPERFFDRFVFNLHRNGRVPRRRSSSASGSTRYADIVDGFAIASPPGPSSATSVSPPS